MFVPLLRPLVLVSLVWSLAPMPAALAQDDPAPDDVVNALENISGIHKGLRRNHAKGVCAAGVFQADAAARELSSSALFSGQAIPVVARLSIAGPNPAISDTAKNPRGLAVQFQLPKGKLHQMAMLNTPVFGAATPQSFYERLLVDAPDPATGKKDPEKLRVYEAKYPESKALSAWLSSHNPPPSYANVAFYSLHAFKFVDAAKGEHWVKWRFEPRDGALFLSDEELAKAPKEFLAQGVTDRTRQGPVAWDMIVSLGEKGDPLDNPTIAWPAERREIKAGTLTLTRAGEDAVGTCEDINFDPNLLSAGVEASPDPILAYRSSAYAVSFGRRLDDKAK